jgi:nitrite reductase/ring-hydroxylating ferredoxin subunit
MQQEQSTTWIQVAKESELAEKGSTVWKHEGKQLALFWQEGQVYALDNRCPHQGYPLREGTLDGKSCTLTCQWHNWKFDVRTGECLQGEDHVRTYPTRQVDGEVWVDLAEPSREEQYAAIWKGLQTAVEKRQFGRLCRELVRLENAGFELLDALRDVIKWRSEYFEFGMSHAHAAAADWVTLYRESDGDKELRVVCVAEAIDHFAHDTLRHPVYPFATDIRPFDGEALLAAIEAEDEGLSISLVRGALNEGRRWSELETWFVRAALSHYNDFGHSLIYVQKTRALVETFGDEILEGLLLPLIRGLCMATREDMLPQFRQYAKSLGDARTWDELGQLDVSGFTGFREEELESLWEASVNRAMVWVNEQLGSAPVEAVYEALLESCARALLHYDTQYQDAYDRPVKQNIGWLHCTHALTFANAVRTLCPDHPALWPQALLQMACWSGRNQAYLDRSEPVEQWFVDDRDGFFEMGLEKVFDHGLLPPIFSAHAVKTLVSVRSVGGASCLFVPRDAFEFAGEFVS